MYACGEGHLATCQWLVEHEHADYDRCDDRGRSCLVYACRSGHANIVEWLLTFLLPKSTCTGWHPLHFACSAGHFDVVRSLLRHDCHHGHVITKTGHSALFMAMHSTTNNMDIVKYLLDWHPSIHLTCQDIEDLSCDKSFIVLLAQRRHSLSYLFDLVERTDNARVLIHLLLLSEHAYSWKQLSSLSNYRPLIEYYERNPLTLKQITRCVIRRSTETSQQIDLLVNNENLRKFLRFEYLN
jgi:ankyrin repeat protein